MPQMPGLEFLARSKEIQGDASRVLMTGLLEVNTFIDAVNRGEIYRFILKPWVTEDLMATVRNAVQRYDLIKYNASLHEQTVAMNARLVELNQSLEYQVGRESEQKESLAALNQALQENFTRSVELCLKVLETFYPALGAQATRVHELCRRLADALEMPPEQRNVFEVSAWLHDIGLVGVPRRLIRMTEKTPQLLKPAERTLLEQHPVLGQELAAFMHDLSEVGRVIRAHHERFDGTGYPDRLRGENIPWLARLLSVAVEFAAHDNPHVGIAEVRKLSGSAFDPEAVRVFDRHRPTNFTTRKERQILFSELQAGMVLAKGIYGANGLLLLPEGQSLNELAIEKLRNHNRVSRINHALVVYC
jgi:response regulator RpfG family c-di-GMP phosphodiesterase